VTERRGPTWQDKTYTALEDKKTLDWNKQGRSKRNIPLPVFQNEPMGRINEFTYKSLLNYDILGCGLRVEITYPR